MKIELVEAHKKAIEDMAVSILKGEYEVYGYTISQSSGCVKTTELELLDKWGNEITFELRGK